MVDDLFTNEPAELIESTRKPDYITEARDATVLILSNNKSDPFVTERRKTVKEMTAHFESQSTRKNIFELQRAKETQSRSSVKELVGIFNHENQS